MPQPDPRDIQVSDPNDFTYVSIKNWQRKQSIINGEDKMSSLVGRPGPITGLVLSLFDIFTTIILKLTFNFFSICSYAFNWIYNLFFGNFKGILPTSVIGGSVFSMKFFRYTLTVLMPPFGVMISKGLYGWFNVAICMLITYVNFIAGIIYAFVITARNRYADQYEDREVENALKNNSPLIDIFVDKKAFFGTIAFFTILTLFIVFCFSYF
jgi:uncharacterized membrane protein YqaE (UPF0057 family)